MPHFAALVAVLLLGAPASATPFGDIDVTVESVPKGQATHGYAEVWVRVENKSAAAAHAVRLTYPRVSFPTGVDQLRAVTRTVTVEPGKVARVALAFPEQLGGGDGLGVAVDGRDQDDGVSLGSFSRGYGGRSHAPQALVLYSPAVDTRFPDWARLAPSLTSPPASYSPHLVQPNCVRAERPAEAWSPNWLGYTRYDGVAVTADDLRRMPADVKAAVGQYVECGGSLLVLGGTAADVPGAWKPEPGGTVDLTRFAPGFGQCLITRHTELDPVNPRARSMIAARAATESWVKSLAPWHRGSSPNDANRRFPVVDDLGTPTTGLLFLMIAFVIVIGPFNLYLLARYRRKLWLFVTVPAVSFGTCLLVFGYMAVSEGWQGRSRVEGFTILDETSRRASTLGWCGFYSPLQPRGGLRFGPDTELTFQNGDDHRGGYYPRRAAAAALAIDWTHEQTLTSGWLAPRVPAHFMFRKSEPRRERVIFSRTGDRVEAVNGLGADLTELWYADDAGKLFRAANIPAGGRVTLTPAETRTPVVAGRTLRDIYAADWADLAEWAARDGPALLAPRTYLGVMAGAPFLDDPLPGAARQTKSAVLGLIREGGDGG